MVVRGDPGASEACPVGRKISFLFFFGFFSSVSFEFSVSPARGARCPFLLSPSLLSFSSPSFRRTTMSNFTIPPGRFKRSEAASHPAGPPSTTATWRGLHERKEEEVEVHGDDLAAGEGGPRIEDFPARMLQNQQARRRQKMRGSHSRPPEPAWRLQKQERRRNCRKKKEEK